MMPTLLELRTKTGKTRVEVVGDLRSLTERHLFRLEKGITPLSVRRRREFAAYYGVAPESIEASR